MTIEFNKKSYFATLERMTENQFCLTRYPQVTLHLILKDNIFARLAPSIRRYKNDQLISSRGTYGPSEDNRLTYFILSKDFKFAAVPDH